MEHDTSTMHEHSATTGTREEVQRKPRGCVLGDSKRGAVTTLNLALPRHAEPVKLPTRGFTYSQVHSTLTAVAAHVTHKQHSLTQVTQLWAVGGGQHTILTVDGNRALRCTSGGKGAFATVFRSRR